MWLIIFQMVVPVPSPLRQFLEVLVFSCYTFPPFHACQCCMSEMMVGCCLPSLSLNGGEVKYFWYLSAIYRNSLCVPGINPPPPPPNRHNIRKLSYGVME